MITFVMFKWYGLLHDKKKIPLLIGWPSHKVKKTLAVFIVVDLLFYSPPFVYGSSVLKFVLVFITLCPLNFCNKFSFGTRYIEYDGLFSFDINLNRQCHKNMSSQS